MIDRKHKDYQEYIKKAKDLQKQLGKALEDSRPSHGHGGEGNEIIREYDNKLNNLKDEYKHLFSEGDK